MEWFGNKNPQLLKAGGTLGKSLRLLPNQRSFPKEEALSDLLPTRPFRKRKRLRKAPLVSSNFKTLYNERKNSKSLRMVYHHFFFTNLNNVVRDNFYRRF